MTSKWKTIRKSYLREFGDYKEDRGFLRGVTAGWAGWALAEWSGIMFVLSILVLAVYWLHGNSYEDSFTSIRKAIEDARGENQQ